MRNYESRIAKLEQALSPETLVVFIRIFGGGELRGFKCREPFEHYFERTPQESEEALHERAAAQAKKWGGLVVLSEDRGDLERRID